MCVEVVRKRVLGEILHFGILSGTKKAYNPNFVVLGLSSAPVKKPSPVGSSHGYQHFIQCKRSSAITDIVPSDQAVICRAKPLLEIRPSEFGCSVG